MLHRFKLPDDPREYRVSAHHERDRSGGFLTVYLETSYFGTLSWDGGAMRVHWSPRLMPMRAELERILMIEIERAASGAPIYSSSPTLTCLGGLT